LEIFLNAVAELGAASMVERRVSSYQGWLVKLGLAKMAGRRCVLDHLPASVPFVRYESDEEPIFPNRYDLKEYQEQAQRVASKQEAIEYYVDRAKRERASTSHETLVSLMAERLRQRGAIPKANRYVDLSARLDEEDYLFEMKSTTEDNPHSQIRRGLSQLYEYRYIQNVEKAKLVLVIENPLPRKNHWMEDYLLNDRGVLLVWDGNGKFHCPPSIRKQLEFL
jgi:vacuolar-type H+-ATPase catalytic subunit A/Vma1